MDADLVLDPDMVVIDAAGEMRNPAGREIHAEGVGVRLFGF